MSPADKPAEKPAPKAATAPKGTSVARGDLEIVIRRAIELAQVEGDVEDRLSENELVRIGNELGLSSDQVRQALYEQPQLESDPRWYDRYYDKPIITASRVVPSGADATMKRLEEYISSREYMQLVRRRAGELAFIPAEDAISRLARSLSRPGSRYHIARARRVVVSVQPIGEGRSHVRLDSDFSEQRAANVSASIGTGAAVGTFTAVFPVVSILMGIDAPLAVELLAAGSAGILTIAGSMALCIRIGANKFRDRMLLARREIEGLLDRAEHSDRLEPPPAPWQQSLRAKFFGSK